MEVGEEAVGPPAGVGVAGGGGNGGGDKGGSAARMVGVWSAAG